MLVQLDGLRPRLLPKALPYPVLSQRIDFGMSLFANRQWVYSSPAKSGDTLVKVDWPISFPNNLTAISLTTHALNVGNVCWLQYDLKNIKSSFYIAFENPSPGNENSRVHCIGIGW